MLSALHLCTLEARRHPVAVAAAEQIQRLPRGGQLLAVAVCGALVFSLLSALLNALYMLAMTLSFVFGGAYMASKAPSKESFEPAFERWFLEDYYPKVAPKLEQASLMGKLEQWLGVNTRQSGASWAYRFWASRCLPAGISDWLLVKIARVNLGTQASPVMVTFVGALNFWMLAPRVSIDFSNLSILDAKATV
mmetsp:Transcript_76960/g.249317  ORF Transcript_76960/g.249317 Transcript_76960/m.249317 type:complete len:193 (-) Transcript_76960:334-912(-)